MDETRPARSARDVLAVLAIFVLGAVLGLAISFAVVHHLRPRTFGPHRGGPAPVERLARELDLDAAQKETVRAIVERGHERMRDHLEETRREIREVLRADQQEKLDRIRPPGPPSPRRGGMRPEP